MSEQNNQQHPALEARIDAIQEAVMKAIEEEATLYEAATGLDRDALVTGRALLELAHGLLRYPLEGTLEAAQAEGDEETIELATDALMKAEVVHVSAVKSNKMAMGLAALPTASVALGLVEAGLEFLSEMDDSLEKIVKGEDFGAEPTEDASDILRNFNSIVGGKDGGSDVGK